MGQQSSKQITVPLARASHSLSRQVRAASANEEDSQAFFHCTSMRWLCNEREQLSVRKFHFNVEALKKLAVNAAKARSCIAMRKTHEGSFCKIYTLTFDNGTELIAKVPNPLVSPPHLVTASEVATMDYARTILGIPIPEVHAWSSRANDTDVGVEFILMDKVNGTELHKRWEDLGIDDAEWAIEQVVEVEKRCVWHRFSQIGSIFYKEHVSPVLQARRLYADGEPDDEASERFRIGPFVDYELWRGSRSSSIIDPGPWPDPATYIIALIRNHQEWLKKYAKSRPPNDLFFRSSEDNTPAAHIDLLERLKLAVPHIIPPQVISGSVLWHTDLHAANVLVERDGDPTIAGVIDWQGMCVAPLFAQAVFAEFARYRGDDRIVVTHKPGSEGVEMHPGWENLPETEFQQILKQRNLALRQKYYENCVRSLNPHHYAVQTYPRLQHIVSPLLNLGRTWYEGTHRLREDLVRIYESWSDLAPGVPVPFTMTPKELDTHKLHHAQMVGYEERVERLKKELEVEGDGWVSSEKYEEVKKRSDERIRSWDSAAAGGPYPFQDGAPAWFVET